MTLPVETDIPVNSVIVIPARLASTRLDRKLLLKETGKSVLQHTYEAASQSQKAKQVIVAADHQEIVAEVESFGGRVVLTDPDHVCGTDRIAEVANTLPEFCLLYTSPSPRDGLLSRMPSSA